MRTTLAAMALGVLSLAGCAGNRCNCTCSTPCTRPSSPPAPAAYKPCVICTANSPAPKPAAAAAAAAASPYTAKVQQMPPAAASNAAPDAKSPWPAVATPAVTPARISSSIQAPAPASKVAAPQPVQEPAVRENLERQPETPTPELPEPTRLPERSSDPVPQRPKLPDAPTDTPPEALNLGQTPEPEVAPIIQTAGTTEEPPPIVPTPVLRRQTDGVKVLTGVVESWRKTWRLRYAPVDVEDANGGRVTLFGGSSLENLREGQRVRVRGVLIPTADRGSAPAFDVQAIEVVD